MFAGHGMAADWQLAKSEVHIFGLLPGRHADAAAKAQETERHS
jgi:hypothetical protein